MFKIGLFPFGPSIPPVPTTVDIGTQTWKIKNLSTVTYRNGDPITHATDSSSWKAACTARIGCYASVNYDSANDADYGLLYNGYAIKDPRQIAPVGYHIPTYDEMDVLLTYVGGTSISGNAMKEIGTTHWITDFGNTNSSGYTDVGAGFIDTSGFPSSFKQQSLNATYDLDINLYDYENNSNNSVTSINYNDLTLGLGYSVRVVKNSSLAIGDPYGVQGKIGDLIGNPNADNFLIKVININTGLSYVDGFGCFGAFTGATDLNNGVANTNTLGASACNLLFSGLSTNIMIDRFNDWYVASANQATTILNNLGLSYPLPVSGPYWTSTEVDTTYAYYVHYDGTSWVTSEYNKVNSLPFLLVRDQYV
jgi:uncharacterized protein (TIGR02145 family)